MLMKFSLSALSIHSAGLLANAWGISRWSVVRIIDNILTRDNLSSGTKT